jgi:DNA-binding response OmpR family regulator
MKALLVIGIDDPESKLAVQDTATACGCELVHATTEHEAVRSLAERPDEIDAVILDLAPGHHAVDLLRAITQSETAPPVIVLARSEQPGAVPVPRHSGVAASVRKPFTSEELVSVIEEVRSPNTKEQGWDVRSVRAPALEVNSRDRTGLAPGDGGSGKRDGELRRR